MNKKEKTSKRKKSCNKKVTSPNDNAHSKKRQAKIKEASQIIDFCPLFISSHTPLSYPPYTTTTTNTHRQGTSQNHHPREPMSEQAKSTETETASAGVTTTITFATLPRELHCQLTKFLTSYETITGLSTSASWLRRLCLPLVEEVHIVVPSLREAFATAQAEGNDEAGFACLPRDDEV
jgi:hypothetical protein